MKKRVIILLCLFSCMFCFLPVQTNAKNSLVIDQEINTIQSHTFLLKEKSHLTEDCGDSLLGDPDDKDSTAWLVQRIFNYIKIIGPILVIILSSVDFIGVIVKGDDEAMGKATKKLTTRLILAALLFFIPTLIEVILDVFGFTSSTCGIQ